MKTKTNDKEVKRKNYTKTALLFNTNIQNVPDKPFRVSVENFYRFFVITKGKFLNRYIKTKNCIEIRRH
jgi:hypothetical protein